MGVVQATGQADDMQALTTGLKTKSDKIRHLGRAGYTRQQIADFLHIRYQHVRNVLVDEERRNGSVVSEGTAPVRPEGPAVPIKSARSPSRACRVDVGANGEVILPPQIMDAAGTGPGRHLLVRFDDDEIKLVTPEATTRKLHAWVRSFAPEGTNFVEELREERRREFEREERDAQT
ncbi:MAG TPA: hypothetical protein VIY09_04205 [Rhizomicrobium sp.]